MGLITKIFKYIDKHYTLTKDRHRLPSIIKDQYGNEYPLSFSSTRHNLTKSVKFMLVEDVGLDNVTADKISKKYVNEKYQEFCDFIMNI